MSILPQQQLFAEFYLSGPTKGDAKRSAMAAGVAETIAGDIGGGWLKTVEIQEFIKKTNRSVAEKLGIDIEWVLTKFRKAFLECSEWTPIKSKGRYVYVPHPNPDKAAAGEMVAAYSMVDPKAAAKFGEMIAKHLKMLTDRVDINDNSKTIAAHVEPKTAEEASRSYQAFMDSCK